MKYLIFIYFLYIIYCIYFILKINILINKYEKDKLKTFYNLITNKYELPYIERIKTTKRKQFTDNQSLFISISITIFFLFIYILILYYDKRV